MNFIMRENLTYVKVSVKTSGAEQYKTDMVTYFLSEAGFDMFDEENGCLCAYIKKTAFDPGCLNFLNGEFGYAVEEIEDKDWNAEWEKNYFKPIVVSGRCVVHSSFHTDVPPAEYDIVIDPKMSFGTGHHQTTRCMMGFLLEADMSGKSVCDMGCGTAVLGILASMRGASRVTGIDIDGHCIRNSEENIRLNRTPMELLLGGAEKLQCRHFDVILANINRNILLADMDKYVQALNPGGDLYMSGFYLDDLAAIRAKAGSLGLRFDAVKHEGDWCAAKFSA